MRRFRSITDQLGKVMGGGAFYMFHLPANRPLLNPGAIGSNISLEQRAKNDAFKATLKERAQLGPQPFDGKISRHRDDEGNMIPDYRWRQDHLGFWHPDE